jgi:DDE_Tnp_1-associated/Transposase DDE domain
MALSLIEALSEVPDPRSRHGRFHPLQAILALTVLAMLRGCRGPAAIAQFGRDHGPPLAHALGFRRGKTPGASWLSELLSRLDAVAFEAALSRWIQSRAAPPVAAGQGGGAAKEKEPVSIDGKALRGSKDGDVPGQHLVSAYAPLVEAVLAQVKVDAKTNEHKAALELLGILPVRGRIVIGDAMFCQRDVCAEVIGLGGDYVFFAKANQPGLQADVAAGFGYEAAARAVAAAFSPRRPGPPGGAREGRPQRGQGARADRAQDVAGDEHPDGRAEVAGPGAGLRADAEADGAGRDDGGGDLRDNQLGGGGGRRRAAAFADADALGDREQGALRQGRDAGGGRLPGPQGQRAAGAGGDPQRRDPPAGGGGRPE